ncbi:COG4454 Uncharacterized copper-binding protein [Burkholderiales bacterium]
MKNYSAIFAFTLTAGTLIASVPHEALAHGNAHHGSQTRSYAQVAPAEQTAWGIAGDPAKVSRVIKVDMSDAMRFSPEVIQIKRNETIRFEVSNSGKVMHEMVIGTQKELDTHAEMMKKHPNMEHDEAYMAHVGPGEKGEIVWHFNRGGEFDFACLVAGHYDAGMRGKIRVSP